MTMKVYIAGPISGKENDNRPAFENMALHVTNSGNIALSPATLPAGLEQHEYMDICFAMLRAADVVFMLAGWTESKGATAEYHYAAKLGKEIVISPSFDDGHFTAP